MIRVHLPVLTSLACVLAGAALMAPPPAHGAPAGGASAALKGAQSAAASTPSPALPPSNTAESLVGGLLFDPQTGHFTRPQSSNTGGWQAFADLLQKASPSVNTAIPLTPAQVTRHIASLIDHGQAQSALDLIEKREAAREKEGTIGVDVQLQYQHARALAALGKRDDAMALWRDMTETYPELPEPWNALAIEYARRGELYRARDALDMALVSDPSFAPALENLGHIQMRLAQQSFERAKKARKN